MSIFSNVVPFTLPLANEVKTLTGFSSTENNTFIGTIPIDVLSKVERLQYRRELKQGTEESEAHVSRLTENLPTILESTIPAITLNVYYEDDTTWIELVDGNHTLDAILASLTTVENALKSKKIDDAKRKELETWSEKLSSIRVIFVNGEKGLGDRLANFAANRSLQANLSTGERTKRFMDWLNSMVNSGGITIESKPNGTDKPSITVYRSGVKGTRGKPFTIRELGELFNVNHQTIVNKLTAFVKQGEEKKELTERQKAKLKLKEFQSSIEDKILKLLTLEVHEHETRNLRFVLSMVKAIESKDELLDTVSEWHEAYTKEQELKEVESK